MLVVGVYKFQIGGLISGANFEMCLAVLIKLLNFYGPNCTSRHFVLDF